MQKSETADDKREHFVRASLFVSCRSLLGSFPQRQFNSTTTHSDHLPPLQNTGTSTSFDLRVDSAGRSSRSS